MPQIRSIFFLYVLIHTFNLLLKEEEALIGGCLHLVKTKLGEPSPSHRSVVNCLSFVVFADLLGYKAPFAHIHAVKLAGSSSVVLKRLGYLFCSYLLGSSHELSLLMVNTMVRDLAPQSSAVSPYDSSNNPIAVGAALSATCYLTPLDSVSTLLPLVLDKLNHPSPYVRGKAISALQHLALQVTGNRFFNSAEQLSSFLHGHPSTVIRKLLSDPHPAVLAVGLQFLQLLLPLKTDQVAVSSNVEDSGSTTKPKEEDEVTADASLSRMEDVETSETNIFQGLGSALIHVQKQILQGRMPPEYIFHSVPSPWLQISIMKMLRYLQKDEVISNCIPELVYETFRLAHRRTLIGWAIVTECILTALEIELPDTFYYEVSEALGKLLVESGTGKEVMAKWLSSNLLYTSLFLLQLLGKRHTAAVEAMMLSSDIQDGLRAALSHPDPSIRRLAVGLITSCGGLSSHDGNHWTAEKICLLLLEECSPKKSNLELVSHVPMVHWKKECLERIIDLTHAPESAPSDGTSWQLAVLLRALPLAPDRNTAILIRDRIQRFLLPPGGDWVDLGSGNIPRTKVLKLLEKHCQSKCASTYLLELYIWVLSQFYHLLPEKSSVEVLQQFIQLGQKVVCNNRRGEVSTIVDVLIAIVQAISHIIFRKFNFDVSVEECSTIKESVQNFLKDVSELDGTPKLIDACNELSKTLHYAEPVAKILARGPSIDVSSMDFTLSFLDGYICEKLKQGDALKEVPPPVPYSSFPLDYYNAELATNIHRQIALGLPIHCNPWKVANEATDAKDRDSLELSETLSLTVLSQSSTVPGSYGASLPDEFMSLSIESQTRELDSVNTEVMSDNENMEGTSRIWTSSGRVNFNQSSTHGSAQSTEKKEGFHKEQTFQQSSSSHDFMALLLHTGNSGIILDQSQSQPPFADPLDRLLSEGFQLNDISS
ncbi:hypothetical protein J437_LFUL001439 [Ladona fulva]|uniref:Clathrin/coatomer adaptor adaptin-like N-terminal domain-containing protein n=1 Tax=Ladona fulva TaxID=123851 RepID=A0A8K0JT77_LADFU|nr:hypothetical protein J437_LFUL001439 [Ladona fulva]